MKTLQEEMTFQKRLHEDVCFSLLIRIFLGVQNAWMHLKAKLRWALSLKRYLSELTYDSPPANKIHLTRKTSRKYPPHVNWRGANRYLEYVRIFSGCTAEGNYNPNILLH